MDRIGCWTDGQDAVFYTKSGAQPVFHPRGANYIQLDEAGNRYHDLFDPGKYDAAKVEQDLAAMQSWAYNHVRVFLTTNFHDQGFGLSAPGIDPAWLGNVADFLRRAAQHGLYVTLTGGFPGVNYMTLLNDVPSYIDFDNCGLLHQATVQDVVAQFWRDFLGGLRALDPALLSAIMAIDLDNESCVELDQAPFTMTSGTIQVWGESYDMADLAQRQQMIDAAAVAWANTLSAVIKSFDPEILTSASLFSPLSTGYTGYNGGIMPAGGNPRYPLRPAALATYSTLDLIDLHLYCDKGFSYRITDELAAVEMPVGQPLSKPLFMGETGADLASYATAHAAVLGMVDLLQTSRRYGFTGNCFWTWNTPSAVMPFWSLTADNDALNYQLSPGVWPNLYG